MKLIKKMRKGFTLIELVVVIAVIAILSAVSVVSYIAITNKAKQSSDEQAVRQMNTALKAAGILGAKDINELYAALSEEGMDAKDYKPLSKDTYFFWDQENNEIVYAKYKDGKYIGIYPESYKDKEQGTHHWFSLSGTIQTVKIDNSKINTSTKTYTLSSAEEVYTVLTDAQHKQNAENIVLAGDVDLKGADISFENVKSLDGGTSGATISNLSQLKEHHYSTTAKEKYYSGLFPLVKSGVTLNVNNVVIENSVIGSYDNGHCGAVIGKAEEGATVNLTKVKVLNCSIYSRQKAGSFVGFIDGASVTMDQCLADTVDIHVTQGECGKLIGAGGKGGSLTETSATSLNKITLEKGPVWAEVKVNEAIAGSTVKLNETKPTGLLICGDDDREEGKTDIYRFFNSNSHLSVVWDKTEAKSTFTYNSTTYIAHGPAARTESVTIGGNSYLIKGALPLVL